MGVTYSFFLSSTSTFLQPSTPPRPPAHFSGKIVKLAREQSPQSCFTKRVHGARANCTLLMSSIHLRLLYLFPLFTFLAAAPPPSAPLSFSVVRCCCMCVQKPNKTSIISTHNETSTLTLLTFYSYNRQYKGDTLCEMVHLCKKNTHRTRQSVYLTHSWRFSKLFRATTIGNPHRFSSF